jgi:hypothetical protein
MGILKSTLILNLRLFYEMFIISQKLCLFYINCLYQARLTLSLWRHLRNSTGIWCFKMVFVSK